MAEIKCVDCLEYMKSIPDNSIDLIITDPPYKVTSRGGCANSMGGYWINELSRKGKIFENNDVKCSEYLPEFYRILKDGTHCYVMINNVNLIEMLNTATSVGFQFIKSLIWNKGNKITGQWYMGCYEYILMFRKGVARPINLPGTPDILSVPIDKLKDAEGHNLHDTEKPVELMRILVENSSNKGETVFDPFMGIGATGVASKLIGRNFIGTEIDEKFFNIAKQRLESVGEIKDATKSDLW